METMEITSAQYVQDLTDTNTMVKATIDGKEMFVPMDASNTHYAEILKQVEAGTLTIEDAD